MSYSNRRFLLVAGGVVLWILTLVAYYIVFSDTWFDEANYAYKSWLAAKGWAQPFVDFRTKYGPVGFYAQAVVQGLFGPSMLAGRIFSALLFGGILFILFDILKRRGGKWLGIAGVSFLAFHPYIVGKFITVNAYPLVGLFSIGALWFLFNERLNPRQKVMYASVATILAFLVRYNLLPMIPLLWVFVYWKWRDWRLLLFSINICLITTIGLMMPYVILDWEFAMSFMLEMFGPVASWLPLPYLHLSGTNSGSSPLVAIFKSVFKEEHLKLLMNVFTSYYHFIVIAIGGVAYLFYKAKKSVGVFLRRYELISFCLTLSILLFLAHFVIGPQSYKIYSLYFIHIFVLCVADILREMYVSIRSVDHWFDIGHAASALVATSIIFSTISIGIFGYDVVFFTRSNFSDTDLARVRRGGEYLASLTDENDTILTTESPHHIFAAGRYEIAPLINVNFTYRDNDDEELLARFRQYNTKMFMGWFHNVADVVVLQRDALNERLVPMGITGEKRAEFDTILGNNYTMVGSIENVYFRKDQRGGGVMEVYRRKAD